MSKKLGKIDNVHFGLDSDRPFLFGINLCLSWGCSGVWVSRYVNISPTCDWSESGTTREQESDKLVDYIQSLLKDSKVNSLGDLIGKPIEVNDKGIGHMFTCDDFRILTEVL